VPVIDWKTAIGYALLVQIAEAVEPSAEYSPKDVAAIQALGYDFSQTLYGSELATDFDPHLGETVTYGFLAISPASEELVAIIRGTEAVWEWIHDSEFLMLPNPIHGGSGMTEDGFTAIYKSLRVGRDANSTTAAGSVGAHLHAGRARTVTVCGHSLGGALATLLALDIALNTECRTPSVYTYACPRTGNHSFAGSFNAAIPASYRIYGRTDLVPKLPPILPLPYEHTNSPFELIPPMGAIKDSLACAHHLTTYLWLMGRQAGLSLCPVDADCRGSSYPGPTIPG
jgi:hypothetical protein